MEISLCMIVKNEDINLRKCLDSVKNIVDEIIIVDTGSNDKTKEIAYEYTEKVYDFIWCDDFGKARNYSIDKAKNSWVLILDGDEIIMDFDEHSVSEFIKLNEEIVGRIKRYNLFEDDKGEKTYIERVNRLFNKNHYKYEGIIHEQVINKNRKDYETKNVDIHVDHIGYTNEVKNRTNKVERNIKLLKESIKNNTDDPYLYYQLGKANFMGKNYEEAYKNFCIALDLGVSTKYEYVEDLIETYGYSLINTERYYEAMSLKKYEIDYYLSPDFNFLMGLIYMNNAAFQESINYYLKCIGENEGKIEGVNSYLAYYNIGVIYECLSFKEEAILYYQRALPYKLAKERIEILNGELKIES